MKSCKKLLPVWPVFAKKIGLLLTIVRRLTIAPNITEIFTELNDANTHGSLTEHALSHMISPRCIRCRDYAGIISMDPGNLTSSHAWVVKKAASLVGEISGGKK